MEPRVIYLLFALHTALSAKHGANVQKKSDPISNMRRISPKMLIQKNYSGKLYEKELTKLQTDIELYKQKIKTHQQINRKNLENKILRRMPQKCKKINCPLDEKPVCAKFFYKNRNSTPFYVNMINECEIKYMKCHRGLESTIVHMDNCHSVIGNLHLSAQTGKKREKRSVKADPPVKATYDSKSSTFNKTATRNHKQLHKAISNVKSATTNKKTNLKAIPNVKTTTLNDKPATLSFTASKIKSNEKILDLKSKKANHKTLIIKSATRNKINLIQVNNSTLTHNKTNLKIGTNKNVKTSKNINLKSEVNTAHKAVSKTNLKRNSKPNVRQKFNAPKIFDVIKNTKKTSAGKHILRQDTGGSIEKSHGEQIFEKNIGKEKMFTRDVFKLKIKAHQVVNTELNNHDPSIKGTIEIDDDVIDVNEVAQKLKVKLQDDDPIQSNKNDDESPSENIEITIEMDDADLEKVLGDENVNSVPNSPVNIALPETQDDDPEIVGKIEIDDENNNKKLKYKEPVTVSEIKGDKTKQHLQGIDEESEDYPLVEEPIVDEDGPFHDEEEYHYEPVAARPIVSLDPDIIDEKEIEDVNKSKPPIHGYNPVDVPPETSNDYENIGDDGSGENMINSINNEDNNINVGGGANDASGGNEPIPTPDDRSYSDDEVDMEEYNAECPRQCPARDMMVCALCQHGIYKTFLSICHMRMFQCRGNSHEQIELVSRFPCVMSAPLISDDPPMQPVGRVSEPNDQDRVLRYVRCREKGLLGKSRKCTFEDTQKINQEIDVTEINPLEY